MGKRRNCVLERRRGESVCEREGGGEREDG